jgi:protein-disulfide isomerase
MALSTNVEPSPPTTVKVSVSGRPSRGPEGAKVTVVEFTDYECPFCKRHFNETYPALIAAYEGRIRYVVRNFPLARHPLAPKAAEAAECAHEQGRFWEYHDVLFRTEALDLESLKRHATGLGLDRSRFDQCLDSGAKAEVVRQDMEDGRRYGVSATPTFFINGEKLTGAKSLDVFRKMIDDRLR